MQEFGSYVGFLHWMGELEGAEELHCNLSDGVRGKSWKSIISSFIRDRIPGIMEANGVVYSVRELTDQEYIDKLNEKLQEELDEYKSASNAEQVEELADLKRNFCLCIQRNRSNRGNDFPLQVCCVASV
jgi:predicted house-cleaning noncanonical NTP pyrophosphatase (MazG superfamily)